MAEVDCLQEGAESRDVGGSRASAALSKRWLRMPGGIAGRGFLVCSIATSALIALATNYSMHLLNLRMHLLGASELEVGVSAAAQALGIVIIAPAAKYVLRGFGIRTALVAAALLTCATFIACYFERDFVVIAVTRAAFAIGLGLLFTLTETLVISQTDATNRGSTVGFYATTLAIGTAAGPAFVGVTGVEHLSSFLFAAAFFLLSIAPVIVSAGAKADLSPVVRSAGFSALRVVPIAFLTAFVFGILDNGGLSLLSLYATLQGYGYSEAASIAAAAMTGGILLQLPIGYASQRFEPRAVLLCCAVGTTVSLSVLPAMMGGLAAAMVSSFFFGGLLEGLYTVGLISISKYCRDIGIAAANGCFVSSCGFGELVGPLLTGASSEAFGSGGFTISLSITMIFYLAMFMVWRGMRAPAAAHRPLVAGAV